MKLNGFLLHFSDSVLPVGGYAHSFGLEGMVQMGMVTDIDSFRAFLLKDVWYGLAHVDLPLAQKAYRSVEKKEWDQLKELDETARALRPTKQLRSASARIGKQTFSVYQNTWQPENSTLKKDCFVDFQSAVVVGAIFAEQQIVLEDCLTAVAYQCYSTLLQASLKLLPMGPRSVQALLFESMQAVEKNLAVVISLPEEQWGSYQPVWDIAASRHERASERLFIS